MINGELIIDNFAGGGGASTGIEMATGVSVDIAINHDPMAIAQHKANHPSTKHYCESVWDVDPMAACKGHSVALSWFSPDCKHFSKAKGGKPKDKNIRGLAWVALRWAALVRPRVIMLENVEEFKDWGPLNRGHRPIKKKKGVTFQKFVSQLEGLGYAVDHRELIAADYGAPTMRKRFFLVARCDGEPIIWPEPTHAPADSLDVATGLKKPYVGAYTQIDFSLPCPSIFDSKEEIKQKYGIKAQRPLAENTMRRIARGLQKFVLDNPEPFIVQCNHGGDRRQQDIREPLPTITGKHGYGLVEPYIIPIGYGERDNQLPRVHDIKEPLSTVVSSGKHYLCAPTLIQYHSETATGESSGQQVTEPIMTVDASNRYGLVSAFIQKYFDGGYTGAGAKMKNPLPTVTTVDHNSICAEHLIQMNNHCDGRDITAPIPTITAGDGHFGEVRVFLRKYMPHESKKIENDGNVFFADREGIGNISDSGIQNGQFQAHTLIKYYGQGTGQDIKDPLDTVTANDRFGLVTIRGVDYAIVDIGLRMLEPKELYGCQGFPDDYIIDRDYSGKPYPRSEQVRRCGNAVCPPIPAALVRANLPELCRTKRQPNCRADRLLQEEGGQLRFA